MPLVASKGRIHCRNSDAVPVSPEWLTHDTKFRLLSREFVSKSHHIVIQLEFPVSLASRSGAPQSL